MSENLTPMMQQYQRIKREIPGEVLLLFRLGDFYEMFFDDAKIASQFLNLTLTQRNGIPMCGMPHHASEGYISKLIQQGRKVAICDQVEEAGQGKGIIRREVTQILSPGTVMTDRFLVANQNNFLVSIYFRSEKELLGFACLDITTGDFRLTELKEIKEVIAEIRRLNPSEILIPSDSPLKLQLQEYASKLSCYDTWTFESETAFFTLRDHFKTQSLDGFGCQNMKSAIGAGGAMFHYLQHQMRRQLSHVHSIHVYQPGEFMVLDTQTQRNLELLESSREASRPTTLVWALDKTVTAMGSRLIKDWISHPLRSSKAIIERHEIVSEFLNDESLLQNFREKLQSIKDLERIIARLSTNAGNARDVIGLKLSLENLPSVLDCIKELKSSIAVEQAGRIKTFPDLIGIISDAIVDDPPLALKEGGLIKSGFHPELDELQLATRSGKEWIAQLQQKEMESTGIKSLKVRFNSVFGYFIEVTASNLSQVPAHYIRKQTISNGERFITPELKEMEGKILGAEERSVKLEYEIFQQIREQIAQQSALVQETARAIGILDVLSSFSEIARTQNYVRPVIDDLDTIEIVEGRHPVLEQIMLLDPHHMGKGGFVPNDTLLDYQQNQVILITGPNMAGKSTYIRQVAIIVLMAQIGSFVPAKSAHIGMVDRIFTRVGASDDLSRGQSTFMMEMNETANILNNATDKSLVILDEIGRGTSTYDGISIAWSVAEYLHEKIGAKTLFATHYHELTNMTHRFKRVKNYNVAVREWNDQIIFLRKIQPGGADRSYGIQVARLAGLPSGIIDRAKEILNHLESTNNLLDEPEPALQNSQKPVKKKAVKPSDQMMLFANQTSRVP
jgi:DNA mismatch repair protein MutS